MRITDLIDNIKIYNLCNYCDNYKCGECSVPEGCNCKEEIEKQIVTEIKADAISEVLDKFENQIQFCQTTKCEYLNKLSVLEEQLKKKDKIVF